MIKRVSDKEVEGKDSVEKAAEGREFVRGSKRDKGVGGEKNRIRKNGMADKE